MPIILALLFGIFSAAFALILELVFLSFSTNPLIPVVALFEGSSLTPFLTFSLIAAAVIEEASKFLFLRQYYIRFPSHPIFLPALFFGLGFASVEVFLAFQNSVYSFAFVGSIALHIATSFLLAFFLRRSLTPLAVSSILAIALAILAHIAYNLSLFVLA